MYLYVKRWVARPARQVTHQVRDQVIVLNITFVQRGIAECEWCQLYCRAYKIN